MLQQKNDLFGIPEIRRSGGNEVCYDELLRQNKLLFSLDLIKEMLAPAFLWTSETDMANDLDRIIDTCKAANNPHLLWFTRLIENH